MFHIIRMKKPLPDLDCDCATSQSHRRLLTVCKRMGYLVVSILGVGILLGSGAAFAAQSDDLDPSFGSDGIVTEPVSVNAPSKSAVGAAITDLAPIGTRGRMVAAIRSWKAGYNFFGIARLRPDGSLDGTFGVDGIVELLHSRPFQAEAVAVQPDGRILAAGYRNTEPGFDRASVLVRLRRDGELDPSFGTAGVVTSRRKPVSGGAAFFALATAPSRVIAVGATNQFRGRRPAGLVVAYRPDGRVDHSFGANGRVIFPAPRKQLYTGLSAVKVLASGKLIVSGYRGGRLFIARLLPNGRLDRTFGGGDGTASIGVGDTEGCLARCGPRTGLALQRRKVLVFGWQGGINTTLIRLNAAGRIDRSFGRRGRALSDAASRLANPEGIALQADGRIVIVGSTNSRVNACDDNRAGVFGAMRFLPNGGLDGTFGDHGLFTLSDSCHSIGFAALAQHNGKVMAGGGLIQMNDQPSPFPVERLDTFLFLTRFLPGS